MSRTEVSSTVWRGDSLTLWRQKSRDLHSCKNQFKNREMREQWNKKI